MRFISDTIGKDYEDWRAGDSIIISSQTGTGKSTFVLNTLLPNAIAHGMHIVYFCNRKILHEQLQVLSAKSLSEFFPDDELLSQSDVPYIHVVTYQYCEQTNQYKSFSIISGETKMSRTERRDRQFMGTLPPVIELNEKDVMYYIFDEAHYFVSDALFNSSTNCWLRQDFSNAVSVYLTATPEPLMWFLLCKSNSSWYNFDAIATKIEKREEMRNSLMDKRTIKLTFSTGHFEIKRNTQAYINDKCREIQPYSDVIDVLKNGLEKGNGSFTNCRSYTSPFDYSYVKPFYFSDYLVLLDKIQKSSDKWLIFVDVEKDGIDLTGRLQQMGVSAVYLSAKNRHRKNTEAYKEFCNIVRFQRYSCRVLVATAVLDCGVSISDTAVRNIVIGHSHKTTFLQMLGRRRVDDGESVDLYIKAYSAKTINYLRYKCEQKMEFLTFFKLLNETSFDRVQQATADYDGMRERPRLSAKRINTVIEHAKRNSALLYSPKPFAGEWFGPYDRVKKAEGNQKALEEYEGSQTALIELLYQYDIYRNAVEAHRETHDPVFYLKLQLSWIGKEYDPKHWVGYEDAINNFNSYLESYSTSQMWLNKTEQEEFSRGCLRLFEKHPVPLQKFNVTAAQNQEKKGIVPGKSKLEKGFNEIGLPYRIKAKQATRGIRQTLWCIISNEI